MQTISKRILKLTLVILVCPLHLMAQQATVKRNVNLRKDPTTKSAAIKLLQRGARLTVLDSTPQGGFYHVKADDGQEGWVWSRNISMPQGSPVSAPAPSGPSTTPGAAAQCDDSLRDHVYNPQRLIVKQQCVAVTGTIVDATTNQSKHEIDGVRHERDGDTHGWLKLDPEFENLLNARNMSDQDGNLVFEIVCKFPVSQPDAIAACDNYQSPVQIPPVGSHVRVVGTYVQDTHHTKWMEIHPVTSITVIP